MQNELDWNYFKYIDAIAATGSLARAGKLLGVNTSTLSRTLQRLENDLDVKLFKRNGNRYVVTPTGETWVARARQVESHVEALAQAEPKLTVTSLEVFLTHYLLERVKHFDGAIEFLGADRNVDLSRREADVAIRFGRPKAGDYVVQKLFDAGHAVYAGRAQTIAPAPEWVCLNDDFDGIQDVRWVKMYVPEPQIRYRVSSCEQIVRLLKATPLLGILPCYVGDRDAELARHGKENIFTRTAWLVVHRETLARKPVRHFVDTLKTLIERDRVLLSSPSAK